MRARQGSLFSRLNLVTVAVNLVCYALIGLALYAQISVRAGNQTQSFVEAAGRQVTSTVTAFAQRYQWDADMLCKDANINGFLEARRDKKALSYAVFVQYKSIASLFSQLINSDPTLLSICLMKDDANLLADGKNILRPEGVFLELIEGAAQYSNRFMLLEGDLCLINTSRLWRGGLLLLRIDERVLYDSLGVNGEGLHYYVVDEENIVLSSSARHCLGLPLPDAFLPALEAGDITDGPGGVLCYPGSAGALRVLVAYDVSALRADNAKALAGMMLLVVAAMLLSIALISMMGRRFAKNIREILQKLGQMREGDFRQPMTLKTGDELERIDESVCDLGANIARLNQSLLSAAQRQKALELRFLQMQINRHFLNNSLSSLRWMAVRNGQEELSGLMENLIAFYKVTLSQDDVLSLGKEVALVENYVRLENVIHLGDLHFHQDIPPELMEIKVCKMTLQPFVENAIHHGKIQGQPLDIWLSAEEIAGSVLLRVEDNGRGMSPERQEELREIFQGKKNGGDSIAIFNTLSRLRGLYGENVDISFMVRQGTAVEIMLPLTQD